MDFFGQEIQSLGSCLGEIRIMAKAEGASLPDEVGHHPGQMDGQELRGGREQGLREEADMSRWGFLGLMWMLGLGAGTTWADKVSEPTSPPVEKVLTGILKWETLKKNDGTTTKGRLLLTSGDRQIALPVTSGEKVKATKAGEDLEVGKFLDKQVTLTAMVHEFSKRGGTVTLVRSVTHIAEKVDKEKAASSEK